MSNTPWDLIDPETKPGRSEHRTTVMSRIGLRHKVMRRVAMRVLGISVESELDKYLAILAVQHAKEKKPELYQSVVDDLMRNPQGLAQLMAAGNSEDGVEMPGSYREIVEEAIERQAAANLKAGELES